MPHPGVRRGGAFRPNYAAAYIISITVSRSAHSAAETKLAVDALSRIEAHRTTDMYWASGVARDAIAHVQARAVMPDNAESDGALAHPTRTPG